MEKQRDTPCIGLYCIHCWCSLLRNLRWRVIVTPRQHHDVTNFDWSKRCRRDHHSWNAKAGAAIKYAGAATNKDTSIHWFFQLFFIISFCSNNRHVHFVLWNEFVKIEHIFSTLSALNWRLKLGGSPWQSGAATQAGAASCQARPRVLQGATPGCSGRHSMYTGARTRNEELYGALPLATAAGTLS